MFSAIFYSLGMIGGYSVRWHHVEHMPRQNGVIYAITCDMDTKQARGMYLLFINYKIFNNN